MLNYGVRMRPSFRPAAVALVLAAALSASGCTPDASGKPPASTPSATALFASDEEALAAAEEAYRKYQHVSDSIYIDGGADPERLLDVASQSLYEAEKAGYDMAHSMGYFSTGGSTFDSLRLKERDSRGRITVYLCEDVSSVDIRDTNNVSVVPSDRPDRFPLVVSFQTTDSSKTDLQVHSVDDWNQENFCLSK